MGSRRKARELALQMLYWHDIAGTAPEEIFLRFEDLHRANAETREFARNLVLGTVERQAELDALIVRQAENWRIERMPAVDRNLLRMALFEMIHFADTPAAVVIDEALEIAKRFSTPKSPQFVNGILDAVRKREVAGPAVLAEAP
jgi:N utilization substance protein B